MSTRYVWERYDIKESYKLSTTSIKQYKYNTTKNTVCSSGDYYKIIDGKFMVYSSLDPLTYGTAVLGAFGDSTDTQTGFVSKYVLPTPSGFTTEPYEEMLSFDTSYGTNVYTNTNGDVIITSGEPHFDTSGDKYFTINRAVLDQQKGDFAGNASSRYDGTYNKNGVTGDFWYVYKGSDNIDPLSVQYPYSGEELEAGGRVTISVSPRTPTYGGEVFYQYQYSIDGGTTWTNYGNPKTLTSVTMAVPDAGQFQARVQASDFWGFTSSTYVYGPTKKVTQLKAYVGIGGKAVALKKGYVGVGGKAMQLAKGYVGVGGKAKKLF